MPVTSLLALFGSWALFAQDFATGWRVIAPVSPLFEVASVTEVPGAVLALTLRNVSQKTIVAYAVRSAVVSGEVESGNQAKGFVPGSTGGPILFERADLKQGTSREIQVPAVLFEDGTSVGSPSLVAYFRGQAIGTAAEVTRLRQVFDAQAKAHAPGAYSIAYAKALNQGIGELPRSETEALPVLAVVGAPVPSVDSLKRDAPDFLRGFVDGANSRRFEALHDLDALVRRVTPDPPRRATEVWQSVLGNLQERYRAIVERSQYFVREAQRGQYR
jgi:hypothetical protein